MRAPRDPLPHPFDAEQVLEDFEEAWRSGAAPALDGLVAALTRADAPEARDLLKDLVTIDLEYRWRPGTPAGDLPFRPRIEDYLRRHAVLGTVSTVPPELVAAEYKVRCWAGDRPRHAEYRTRFPARADAVLAELACVDRELAEEGTRKVARKAEPASEAPAATSAAIFEVLRKHQLLGERQLQDLRDEQAVARFPDALTFAQHLLGRDWITPFQANWLVKGRGDQLVVGSYVLLGRLGEGAMGKVYRARHQYLGRVAALKVLRKGLLAELGAEGLARFYQEVEAAGRLSHPHVIHAYDAGPAGTAHIIAMEYHESIDLARLVKQAGPLPVEQACDYVRQAALGLQHAHERGLVHRDIKPSNLLVALPSMGSGPPPPGASAWGLVKILDLGLARLSESLRSSKSLTLEGHLMGTPDYMAPEQAVDPHSADTRADLYSLGCTLYFLLTAQPPFAGGNFLQKVNRHRSELPRAVQSIRPDVPAPVAYLVHRLLAKDPAARFASPMALAAALAVAVQAPASAAPADVFAEFDTLPGEATVENSVLMASLPTPPRRRWRRWALAGVAMVAVGFAALLALPRSSGQRLPSAEPPRKVELEPRITNSIGMKLTLIPAGKFLMGSPNTEPGRHAEEGPQHLVTIPRPFYMGIHEVTQAHYQRVVGTNPAHFHAANGGGPNHPVECVSWNDAVLFCKKLSEMTGERNAGRVYRLPTEAEWEYACRAGSTNAYGFGDVGRIDSAAWHKGNSGAKSHEVGTRPANAFGLFDISGNVWEWCADYEAPYADDKPRVDPRGPDRGTMRIFRGGCWMSSPDMLRAGHRYTFGCGPQSAQFNIGFRVVCDLPASAR
jgi:formylglycine-generating enzyme required for sulfatase activity